MGGSWMGSHFTNDDLVKESRMTDDYTYEITFRGERDGREVIDLTLTPLPEAAVVWGKVTVSVLKEGWIPPSIDYYDEDMDLARNMTYADGRDRGGRRIPAKREMRPTDKPGEHTEIVYHDIECEIDPSDDIFTRRSRRR